MPPDDDAAADDEWDEPPLELDVTADADAADDGDDEDDVLVVELIALAAEEESAAAELAWLPLEEPPDDAPVPAAVQDAVDSSSKTFDV